jgi:hypothetical protein
MSVSSLHFAFTIERKAFPAGKIRFIKERSGLDSRDRSLLPRIDSYCLNGEDPGVSALSLPKL